MKPRHPTRPEYDQAKAEWARTLEHFGQPRPLVPREHFAIERAVAQHGFDAVRQALMGARHEPKTERFDPAEYVNLDRVLLTKNFLRFVGLGAKQDARLKQLAERKAMQEEIAADVPEELPPADPARVAKIVEQAFGKNAMPGKPVRCQGAHEEGKQVSSIEQDLGPQRFRVTRFECRVCGAVFSKTERIA